MGDKVDETMVKVHIKMEDSDSVDIKYVKLEAPIRETVIDVQEPEPAQTVLSADQVAELFWDMESQEEKVMEEARHKAEIEERLRLKSEAEEKFRHMQMVQ